MWLHLQVRKIHARPYCRRLFPSPFRKTFRILRGYSRSNIGPEDPHGVR